jgi:ParB-like nuclease family protein
MGPRPRFFPERFDRISLEEAFTYDPVGKGPKAPTWRQVRAWYERECPDRMAVLRQSIFVHGIQDSNPIWIDPERRAVIDGHKRLLAALDVGVPDVPVRFAPREADPR